jgi:hypothetical protein
MAKKKTRVPQPVTPPHHDRTTFRLVILGGVVLGMFQYTGLLVVGSVIFVGFFGWLWWTRRTAAASVPKKKVPARAKRKPRTR